MESGMVPDTVQLIVLVPRALREHRPEDFDVGGHGVALPCEPRREALLEVAGGRVQRVIEMMGILVDHAAVSRSQALADVNDVESCPRRQLESDLDRRHWSVNSLPDFRFAMQRLWAPAADFRPRRRLLRPSTVQSSRSSDAATPSRDPHPNRSSSESR